MIILAIRHGNNLLPTIEEIRATKKVVCKGLKPEGVEKVKDQIPYLKGRNIVKIYSSPRLRARESAQIISKGLAMDHELHPLLRDVDIPVGDEMVKAAESLWAGEKSFIDFWFEGFEGLETPAQYVEQIRQALKQILPLHKPNDTILLVCHGETIRALISILIGIPIEEAVKIEVGYAKIFEFEVNAQTLRE